MTDKLYQPKFQEESSVATQVNQIQLAADRYTAWRELIKTKTMRQYWDELGITIGTSVGGHKAIMVGEGAITNLARNSISALNAIADLPKYAKLEWHEHISMFDPRRDAFDIKVTWNPVAGLLEFFSWMNGSYVPSLLSQPPALIIKRYCRRFGIQQGQPLPKFVKDILNKQRNIVAKHHELEHFLSAQVIKGSRYMIVLSTTEALEHFEKNIEPYLDKPFDEYYQSEIKRWNEADAEHTLTNAGQTESANFHPIMAENVKSDRVELVNALLSAAQPTEVFYTTLSCSTPQKRTYDPNQPDNTKAPFITLKQIIDAPGSFKFSKDGASASRKASPGKASK